MLISYDDNKDHRSVEFASEFTQWERRPMQRKGQSTRWVADVPNHLPIGESFMYKYVVDGEWVVRDDVQKKQDESGIENNLLVIVDEEEEDNEQTPLVSKNRNPNRGLIKRIWDAIVWLLTWPFH